MHFLHISLKFKQLLIEVMKPQASAILLLTVFLALSAFGQERRAVIRTNQLGYLPGATKVAVYLGPAPAPEEAPPPAAPGGC